MQCIKLFSKFRSIIPSLRRCNFIHKYKYRMDEAYMRCPEGSEVFEIAFQYNNENLKINRQFNFSRKLSENVEAFLSRISTNVDKIVNKKQKKKDVKEVSDISKEVELIQNGVKVSGDTLCKDLFNNGGDIRLKLVDKVYKILINTPWIKTITLPKSMMDRFFVYPSKFETQFVELNHSDFIWYRSIDKTSWTEVGHEFIYRPNKYDIGCYLKLSCVPKNSTISGPHTEVISTETIEASPGVCLFDFRHNFTKNKLNGNLFRVVSYNLLADLYCDSDYSRSVLFPYCASYALNIDYRKQLILKELIGYNADIICLQEVDERVFDNDLNIVLPTVNMKGVFNAKGSTREGLACFFNSERFRLLLTTSVVLGEKLDANPLFSSLWHRIKDNENLIKRLTDLGTTLQLATLESHENNEILLVANTHLYFHPDADHIRLLQAGISNIYVEDYIKQLVIKYPSKRVSLIFCGDFNTVPECGIYKLFTTGEVPTDFVDWSSNENEAIENVKLTNKRILASACGTPQYTNFTAGFQACLDYIFYEKSNFEVAQVVPLPSVEELSAHIAIPSVAAPSDHVSLIADLKWL